MAVNCDPTTCISCEHILSMSGWVDPPCYGALNGIILTHVISDILRERSLEEGNFFATLWEAFMAHWDFSESHRLRVLHSNVVEGLVPWESWQLHTLAELVGQIQRSDTPLLRLTFASTLGVVPFTGLFIYEFLGISQVHGFRAIAVPTSFNPTRIKP